MATVIIQEPISYLPTIVGQQIIFTLQNDTIVNSNFNVKFCAAVHVHDSGIALSNDSRLIGTFKTSPNAEGVGIFDLRPILETFVKPDNEAYTGILAILGNSIPQYKGVGQAWPMSGKAIFPMHLIDKFSCSKNGSMMFAVNFYVEFSTSPLGSMQSEILSPTASNEYMFINGVLDYADVLDEYNGFGFNMSTYQLNGASKSFLTNSPAIQYASIDDYGTLPFVNYFGDTSPHHIDHFSIDYYDSTGSSLGNEDIDFTVANGASDSTGFAAARVQYLGAFPANLRGWSTTFQNLVSLGTIQGGYYTVSAVGSGTGHNPLSKAYTINILCPNLKGFEPIRLTWLNKWGTWDYYTFNMKSTKSINSKRIPYNQMSGTWNKSGFEISGYKGGSKNFRVNSTEKIKINTDFVTEAEGVWFQELVNSTDVYVLEGFQSDGSFSALNQYVQPATLTTSSYTTKTIANDKLMQYTFEIEKSKMTRTQSV